MKLEIGQLAPDFTLQADSGSMVTLSALRGKKVVLYFYPKDDTPGCTQEACDFRDNLDVYNKDNAVILGVSRDSIESHIRFRQKYSIPFPLLSDEIGRVCEAYGVWQSKTMMGKKYMGIVRSTFLIDEAGVIRQIWTQVKVDGHIKDVLSKINA